MGSKPILDPWSSEAVEDYQKVMEDFGIAKVAPDMVKRLGQHRLFRRNIVFSQRDLGRVLKAAEEKKPFAAMSGIKPSNIFHLGSKLVADELVAFQGLGARVFYCVADIESLHANGQPIEESVPIAVDNAADALALGIDPKTAFLYKQSACPAVQLMGYCYAKNVTNNMLRSIYGDKEIGLYMSALVQVGDILLPQTAEFGGLKPVVVPVGIDQDPHIRLTRDIAAKHGLVLPSSTYHKFMKSLTGDEKMSKSNPGGMITLSDSPEQAKKKVLASFTGGRNTVEEQRRLGGEPLKCTVYDLLVFHLEEDDAALKRTYDACTSGSLSCGDCKKAAAEKLAAFLRQHQEKKRKMLPVAEKMLTESSGA
jgi:tryptophanyl-tRNA synthetase